MTTDSTTPEVAANGNRDLVTICAWTKAVRYGGEWISVEAYLERRYGVVTSHGISPRGKMLLEQETDEPAAPREEPAPRLSSARLDPRRLDAVRATGLLDSSPPAGLDRITRIGARLLDVPATFVSLVDEHRDFYVSHCGFGEPLASERQLAGQTFCHFTIDADRPLVIPDTRAHPVYRHVPTVESLGVAAYLGAPLVLLSGAVVGALCAIDYVPRGWTDAQVQDVVDLAALALSEIELRHVALDSRRHR